MTKTFKDFHEMATKHIFDSFPCKENEKLFEIYLSSPDLLDEIKHSLPGKYKIFKSSKESFTYFLSLNGQYKGSIGFQKLKIAVQITCADSKLSGGFYGMMIPIILSNHNKIYSDVSLSDKAITSYNNLSKMSLSFKLKVQTQKGIFDYSEDLLLDNPRNRVLIENADIDFMFENYYNKIKNTYRKWYEEDNPDIYKILYCDDWNKTY